MEQKIVSFKVAKAIKEAGYPQSLDNTEYGYALNEFGYFDEPYDYDALYNYHRTDIEEFLYFPNMCRFSDNCEYCVAPTYLDVWLWLWINKKAYIQVEKKRCVLSFEWGDSCTLKIDNSPEEAIIAAIDYLVDNELIK